MNDDDEWPLPPAWLNEALPRHLYLDKGRISLPALAGHSPAEVAAWIAALCDDLGVSPAWLAQKAGLAASTLNRFLRQKQSGANLSARTIEQIRSFAEPRWQELYDNDDFSPKRSESAEGYMYCSYPYHVMPHVSFIIGRIYNNRFVDVQSYLSSGMPVMMPLHYKLQCNMLAFEIEEENINEAVKVPTQFISCVPICVSSLRPKIGSLVVAFRRKDALIECGLWVLERDPGGRFWLMPTGSKEDTEGVFVGAELHAHLDRLYIALLVLGSSNESPNIFD